MQLWKKGCRKNVAFFFIFLFIFSQNFNTVSMTDEGNMRLPKSVLPSSYDIKLFPIIEEGNFTTMGYIEILVDCFEITSNISMNSADIDIDQSSISVRTIFIIVIRKDYYAIRDTGHKFIITRDYNSRGFDS